MKTPTGDHPSVLSKGTEFDGVPAREIKRVQREPNDHPRALLNNQKPDEVINQLIALKVWDRNN